MIYLRSEGIICNYKYSNRKEKNNILLVIYMASLSAIAEGGSVVTADQINYKQKMFSHPDYKFELQQPNTYGQDIVLGVSQTQETINYLLMFLTDLNHSYYFQLLFLQVLHLILTRGMPTKRYRHSLIYNSTLVQINISQTLRICRIILI